MRRSQGTPAAGGSVAGEVVQRSECGLPAGHLSGAAPAPHLSPCFLSSSSLDPHSCRGGSD